jgi:hypothetical protein
MYQKREETKKKENKKENIQGRQKRRNRNYENAYPSFFG